MRRLQLLELAGDRHTARVRARRSILRELLLHGQVFPRLLDLVGDIRVALVHDREERSLLRGITDVRRVEHRQHRVAEWVHVAVDREAGEGGLQLRDRRRRVLDALPRDGRIVIRLVERPLGRFELGLGALHVRVDGLQRRVDLTVAGLQRVDLRGDQGTLLADLLLLALLVVEAVAISARRQGRAGGHAEDERQCQRATEVSPTGAHGEGSSPGTGT